MKFGNHTYAQHGDDIILLAIFDSLGIQKPSYLDIGAGAPFSGNNTALLYERGSRGINVEANPVLIDALRSKRPGDINLSCGVGTKRGKRTFYRVNGNYDLSSFVQGLAEQHGPCLSFEVPVWTISDIVIGHADGIFPDLLSLDIEGMDYEVLDQAVDENGPKVICVETIHCGDNQTLKFVELLMSRGYVFYFRAGANSMFVKRECREIILRGDHQ